MAVRVANPPTPTPGRGTTTLVAVKGMSDKQCPTVQADKHPQRRYDIVGSGQGVPDKQCPTVHADKHPQQRHDNVGSGQGNVRQTMSGSPR